LNFTKHINQAARWIAISILVLVMVSWVLSLAVSFDVVADVNPDQGGVGPSDKHWLGTDHMGRDVFWRMVTGSDAFVGPGLLACGVTLLFGVPTGAIAGYLGGIFSSIVRFLYGVLGSIPRFVLVLVVCTIYGNDPSVIALTAGIAYAPALGEAIYERVDRMRREDFVKAAKAHGLSQSDILFRQILWHNCRRLITRHCLFLFGFYLVLESTLSYIGDFGVEEPNPSWGNMLAFEFGETAGNALAWLGPAFAIWCTVLAVAITTDHLSEQRRA